MFGIFTKENKGNRGEKKVARKLKKLPGKKYILVNDIMLENNYGTTQVDHIVVSIYGVFVIETKNYLGNIYGNDYIAQWTQEINGRRYYFHNPIKQNYAHAKAVQHLLHIKKSDIISMVVFADTSERCWLEVESSYPILHISRVKRYIKKGYKEVIFTEQDVEVMAQELLNADITSNRNKRGHIREIKHRIKSDQKYLSRNRCPRCGRKLHYMKRTHRTIKVCRNSECNFSIRVEQRMD